VFTAVQSSPVCACPSAPRLIRPTDGQALSRLLERFPPEIALPDLCHELAQCPRRGSMSEPCQVGYSSRNG
jgi:hypothetical protein